LYFGKFGTNQINSIMKKIWIILSLLFLQAEAMAQKVTFKKDTIYKDGKPYGLFKAKGNMITGQDYSLQSLKGKELVFFKLEGNGTNNYFKVIFRESGKKAYVPVTENRKSLAREMVMNEMILNDEINPEGEKRFLQIYDKDLSLSTSINSTQGNNNSIGANYEMIERDRSAKVQVYGFTIQQDLKEIGVFEKNRDVVKSADVFSFQLPNGTKIAQALFQDDSESCQVITFKDNKEQTIYIQKTTFDSEMAKQIAIFLIKGGYL
jgi:hypothetical protein